MGRHKLKSVNLQGIELDTIKIKHGKQVKELTKDKFILQVELHIQRREEQKWE